MDGIVYNSSLRRQQILVVYFRHPQNAIHRSCEWQHSTMHTALTRTSSSSPLPTLKKHCQEIILEVSWAEISKRLNVRMLMITEFDLRATSLASELDQRIHWQQLPFILNGPPQQGHIPQKRLKIINGKCKAGRFLDHRQMNTLSSGFEWRCRERFSNH